MVEKLPLINHICFRGSNRASVVDDDSTLKQPWVNISYDKLLEKSFCLGCEVGKVTQSLDVITSPQCYYQSTDFKVSRGLPTRHTTWLPR